MKLLFGCQKCRRHRGLVLSGSQPLVTQIDCTCGSLMIVTHAAGEFTVRRAA